jgi:ATP-dependent DNA ligase
MTSLPWFPPAPAAGPTSILSLPPDDWALEPKIDGIRVIWLDGFPFTRQGTLLSPSKGADRLTQLLAELPHALDGEWVPATDEYYAFDLPDCPLDYDGRRLELARLMGVVGVGDAPLIGGIAAQSMLTRLSRVRLVASYTAGHFPQVYAGLNGHGAEGVVLKRRRAHYGKNTRPGVESRDWLKRRFAWDQRFHHFAE